MEDGRIAVVGEIVGVVGGCGGGERGIVVVVGVVVVGREWW